MGGSASSQKIEEEITEITTTTTTNVGDIGLTGDDAVDMAAIIESGATERMKIAGDMMESLSNTTGAGINQLIAGAGNMILTAGEVSKSFLETAGEESEGLFEKGQQALAQLVSIPKAQMKAATESEKSELVKALPWITVAGAAALIAAVSFRN